MSQGAEMDADETCTIGRHTLHRIEHGQRELTLSEIVALAGALEIAPSTLIRLPILAPANGPTDAAERATQTVAGLSSRSVCVV